MNKYKIAGLVVILVVAGTLYYRYNESKSEDNRVVAKVGSSKITVKDMEDELAGSPPAYQNYLSTLEGRKQFLDILLKEKILLNAAEKSGVDKRQDIQRNLKEYKERMKEQEKEFRKGIVLREFLRELQDGELKVTDAELKQYYEDNRNEYQNPVRVSASHILCSSEEEAGEALKRVKKGEDFSKVAQEVSKDPSAMRGGKIGEVMKGDLSELPEFEKELFGMKRGSVSGVVKTKIGYHVIKKDDERKLAGQSYEDVVPQIRRVIEKKKFDEWIEQNKEKQNLWIDEKVMASISIPASSSSQEEVPPSEKSQSQ